MAKKLTTLIACAALAATLAGCSGGQTGTSSTASESSASSSQGSQAQSQQGSQDAKGGKLGNSQGGMGNRGGGGGGRVDNDADAQAVIDATASKFQQFTYNDGQTGSTLEYSLFVPEGAGAGEALPLVMFIPDSTGAGIGAQAIVEGYYGADVWASDEDQARHPAYVLVPAFTGTATTDSWEVSDEVDMCVRLIENLEGQYNIDASRIYATGQSMGCMSSLYLNSEHPGFFAASMYVSGQWDISVLKGLEDQRFFYIVAGGDEKASAGQDEVMAMLDADGVPYSFGEWSAQNSQDEQDAAADALVAEGRNANMVRFEAGTVLSGQGGMEHMASFNYAYKLSPVRDWLFEQSL